MAYRKAKENKRRSQVSEANFFSSWFTLTLVEIPDNSSSPVNEDIAKPNPETVALCSELEKFGVTQQSILEMGF